LKIAVIGGTGFVGSKLMGALLKTDYHIRLLEHRKSSKYKSESQVESVQGDIHDYESMEKAFEGIDVVYHVVGIIAETKHLTFQKTIIEGTQKLVDAAKKQGVKKIIYVSALGTEKNAQSRYFKAKYSSEQSIINSSLKYVIFRPSIIYGRDDSFVNKFKKMIKFSPVVPIIGDGKYRLQPIKGEELGTMMVESILNKKAENQIIDTAGPVDYQFVEIIAMLKRHLNKNRINIYFPIWMMKLNARILEKILKPAPLTTDQIIMLQKGSTCDITKQQEIFGLKLTPLEEGLKEYTR